MAEREVGAWWFAWGATFLQFFLGGWTFPLQVLVTFIVLDYLSGVAAAWVRRDLSSHVGARGIAKKVGILALVGVGHLLDQVLGLGAPVMRTAVIWFYIANEGLSIIENLSDLGIPVPESVRGALARMRNESGKEAAGCSREE